MGIVATSASVRVGEWAGHAVHLERVVAQDWRDGEGHEHGRTMLRASYGRFSQGVLTGEIGLFHPAVTPITTMGFESATGGYTRLVSVVDNQINLRLDRHTRAPHTDEYSVGLDRELRQRLAVAIAYVRKDKANFIGWTDIGGLYREGTRTLLDGRSVPVFELINNTRDRRFLLTNQDGYEMTHKVSCWSPKDGGPTAGRRSALTRFREHPACSPLAGRLPAGRGSRRLSSQTLLDMRVSKTFLLRRIAADRIARGHAQRAQRHCGRGAGFRKPVQSEFRSAEHIRGSPPSDGRPQGESRSLSEFLSCP